MTWCVPPMWEEGDVWIIGGGPSIAKQFAVPDKVVRSVVQGSALLSTYSSYMSLLHDKHVIGINVAYQIGDWIDMVFFGDGGFFLKYQEEIASFSGLKVSCSPKTNGVGWIKYVARDKKQPRGISNNPKMVSWNGNSGAAAISIAANAGARRIILLGFDMKLGEHNNQHFHDVYGRGAITEERRRRKMPFHKHLRGFPAIAEDAKRRKIEILNANPDSAITCFRKVSVNEILQG